VQATPCSVQLHVLQPSPESMLAPSGYHWPCQSQPAAQSRSVQTLPSAVHVQVLQPSAEG
jgi:hypothetical protein